MYSQQRVLNLTRLVLRTDRAKPCEKARWFVADFLHFPRVRKWEGSDQHLECKHASAKGRQEDAKADRWKTDILASRMMTWWC
jgi:hypothetical protein